jgi:membrane protein DedA with SNARE-associated domain
MTMWQALENLVTSISGWPAYLVLWLLSLGENLFPPMPGDTFVVLGAVLVAKGQLSLLPTYLATTAGSISGFMVLFFAGRRWGRALLEKNPKWLSGKAARRTEALFERYGYWMVAANRFLPSLRTVVAFISGTLNLKTWKVALLGFASCAVWNAMLIGIGIWAGMNWKTILADIQIVLWILLAAFVGFVWFRIWKNRRKAVSTP